MICAECSLPILEPDVAHDAHEDDCVRLVIGQCSCDLHVHAACCRLDRCVEVHRRLIAAHKCKRAS